MTEENNNVKRRRLIGTVVSDKMDKTVVVRVQRAMVHPKYNKRYTVSQKFKAHDSLNSAKIGDKVTIEETRPISKDKHWRIVQIEN
ncbi:MAG: 30S ribosomal protein S17 [Candidatus Uhrbacteria bacterium]|nr:30S ribosomal protein S17 [Candidatus Uhrbacteria bacterium]